MKPVIPLSITPELELHTDTSVGTSISLTKFSDNSYGVIAVSEKKEITRLRFSKEAMEVLVINFEKLERGEGNPPSKHMTGILYKKRNTWKLLPK